MRLGKLQASGFVEDAASDDVRDEVTAETAASESAAPRPVIPEREQVSASG